MALQVLRALKDCLVALDPVVQLALLDLLALQEQVVRQVPLEHPGPLAQQV